MIQHASHSASHVYSAPQVLVFCVSSGAPATLISRLRSAFVPRTRDVTVEVTTPASLVRYRANYVVHLAYAPAPATTHAGDASFRAAAQLRANDDAERVVSYVERSGCNLVVLASSARELPLAYLARQAGNVGTTMSWQVFTSPEPRTLCMQLIDMLLHTPSAALYCAAFACCHMRAAHTLISTSATSVRAMSEKKRLVVPFLPRIFRIGDMPFMLFEQLSMVQRLQNQGLTARSSSSQASFHPALLCALACCAFGARACARGITRRVPFGGFLVRPAIASLCTYVFGYAYLLSTCMASTEPHCLAHTSSHTNEGAPAALTTPAAPTSPTTPVAPTQRAALFQAPAPAPTQTCKSYVYHQETDAKLSNMQDNKELSFNAQQLHTREYIDITSS